MKPNELGKAAGFSKRDVSRMGKAEEELRKAQELIRTYEELTGEPCAMNEDCNLLLEKFSFLRERMFETETEDELGG
jgi:hypothetical protein